MSMMGESIDDLWREIEPWSKHWSERLIEAVPELRERYQQELDSWDGEVPGAYIIFGDVLLPFLLQLLATPGNERVLQRIFAFLEEMATHPDQHVRDLVQVGVCEQVSGNSPELLAEARKYMGIETERLSREIAVLWGHESPSARDSGNGPAKADDE